MSMEGGTQCAHKKQEIISDFSGKVGGPYYYSGDLDIVKVYNPTILGVTHNKDIFLDVAVMVIGQKYLLKLLIQYMYMYIVEKAI